LPRSACLRTCAWTASRRSWRVNDAILRHNPHIVAEWLVRVQLCGDDRARALKTYAQAVRAVEPEKAVGRLDKLWLGFATVYASAGQLSDARAVLEQAVRVSYASRGHAEHVWCRYAEMEVLHRCYDRALVVLTRATSGDGGTPTVQHSTRLWAFLADITESVHGGDAAAAVYSAMLRARVATPQLVLHHAALLRSLGRPDAVLRLYEQAVSIFRYPSAAPLWLAYLRALHSGRNPSIERTRDVCRQAVAAAPPAHLRPLLLLWARVEEEAGTPRALMRVLQQAVRDVPVQHRLDMYLLYAAKATELFGGVRARAVMEEALQRLPDAQVHVIALRFAAMERRLGDLDRARAIYRFACQVTDPRAHQAFWAVFHAFEAKHGSQETFREMLRLRRATRAQFELAQVNTQSLKAGEEAQREEEAFQEEARGPRKRGEAEEQ
jgi:pre-mRNA-splicing factor SYF1